MLDNTAARSSTDASTMLAMTSASSRTLSLRRFRRSSWPLFTNGGLPTLSRSFSTSPNCSFSRRTASTAQAFPVGDLVVRLPEDDEDEGIDSFGSVRLGSRSISATQNAGGGGGGWGGAASPSLPLLLLLFWRSPPPTVCNRVLRKRMRRIPCTTRTYLWGGTVGRASAVRSPPLPLEVAACPLFATTLLAF